MGELLSYMLRSSLLLATMYMTYKWVMSGHNQHAYNRAAILSVYLLALLLPALPRMAHLLALQFSRSPAMSADVAAEMPVILIPVMPEESPGLIPILSVATYMAGAVSMAIATSVSYLRLARMVRRGEKRILPSGATLVLTDNDAVSPFSWRRYIVMSHKDYAECGNMILTHEQEHLRQHHWLDMALAQAMIVMQWFNPAAWLMRDELRAIHEYQADAAVLKSGADARQYQLLLIKKAVGKSFPALANSLNHSKLKKRITMMLKSKSRKSRKVLALALVPAALAAVAVCNIPAVASALRSVENARMPETVSQHKVTNNIEAVNTASEENLLAMNVDTSINVAEPAENSVEAPAQAESKETPAENAAEAKPKYIFKVDGKEITPDADGNFEYQGTGYNVKILDKMSPDNIASMKINKEENTIEINLKGEDNNQSKSAARMPHFHGGYRALLNYVMQNVRYPDGAPADGKTYRVVVSFEISATGKVGEAKVIRSQGELFDNEALRVIKTLPDFEPACDENGSPISTMYALPIWFKTTAE